MIVVVVLEIFVLVLTRVITISKRLIPLKHSTTLSCLGWFLAHHLEEGFRAMERFGSSWSNYILVAEWIHFTLFGIIVPTIKLKV